MIYFMMNDSFENESFVINYLLIISILACVKLHLHVFL